MPLAPRSRTVPQRGRLASWPASGAGRSPGSVRAPSTSRPSRLDERGPSSDVEDHVHLVGDVALDLEVAGHVRLELELGLDAGRHLLLEVVSVYVVVLVAVRGEAEDHV